MSDRCDHGTHTDIECADCLALQNDALESENAELRGKVAAMGAVEQALNAWLAFRASNPDHWWDMGSTSDKAWADLDDAMGILDDANASENEKSQVGANPLDDLMGRPMEILLGMKARR